MNPVQRLRLVGFLEGLSFLVLLFVAMPLKYLWGMPMAVRITGSLHGLLFVVFVLLLFRATGEYSWPLRRAVVGFIASIVPFGTFVFDRTLRAEVEKLRAAEREGGAPRP